MIELQECGTVGFFQFATTFLIAFVGGMYVGMAVYFYAGVFLTTRKLDNLFKKKPTDQPE